MFHHIQSRPYGLKDRAKIFNIAQGNVDFMQRLTLEKKLEVHSGCVNTICWNQSGTCILSGSDDQHLVITDPYTEKKLHKIRSGHRSNIFSAKFLPGSFDRETISCAGDGKIFYTDVNREDTYGTFMFDCHFGTTYEVIVIPNEASTFLSCGEDGTVRFFDLRAKTTCAKSDCKDDILINCRSAVTSLAANPMLPWQLAIGCSDSSVRIYDRRMLGTKATGNYAGKGIVGLLSSFTPPSLEKQSYRITSLNYSPDGEEILVSYSSEHIYLFGTKEDGEPKSFKKEAGPPEAESFPDILTSDHQPSSEGAQGASGSQEDPSSDGSRQPPIKRLRLRGDWSDTGPGARPERERRETRSTDSPSAPEQPAATNTPRTTIMQRMSDLLTRWLDGSMRQDQQEESTVPSDENPVGELPTLSYSIDESVPDAVPGSSRASDTQAMDTAEIGGEGRPVLTLDMPGTSQQQTDGHGVAESGSSNTAAVVTARGRDSTESRSDESQASFVQKVESMDMEDSDPAGQETAGADGGAGATLDKTGATLDKTGANLDKTGATLDETGESLDKTGATLDKTGATLDKTGKTLDKAGVKPDNLEDSIAGVIDKSNKEHAVIGSEQTEECTDNKVQKKSDKREDCDTEMYDPMHPTFYFDQRSCDTGAGLTPFSPILLAPGASKIGEMDVNEDSSFTDMPMRTESDLNKIETGKDTESLSFKSKSKDCCLDTGQGVTGAVAGTSTAVEQERALVRESMNAAVENLRSNNVEPVISLHYSSEGTSNSVIKLGFTNFQSLEDEISAARNGRGIEQDHSVSDNHSTANGCGTNEATTENRDITKREEQVNSSEEKDNSQEKSMFYSEPEVTNSLSDSYTVESCSSSDTLLGEGSSVSDGEGQDSAIGRDNSAKTSGKDWSKHEHLAGSLPEDISRSCDSVPEDISAVGPDKGCSAHSAAPEPGFHNLAVTEREGQQGSKDVTTIREPVRVVVSSGPEEMIDDERPSTSEQDPSTPARRQDRQRRVGYSGPPTGDFQLPHPEVDTTSSSSSSNSNSSSDDDDDEAVAVGGNLGGTRRPRVQLDRTSAALRLQAFHRKRQKAKEDKEMETKNVFRPTVKKMYKGHRNARTMIKEANFWGNNFVISGSDCGHIFIWDRESTKPVMLIEGDKHVVNCIQPHPYDTLLASSGIDYDIKIWAPLNDKPCYDEPRAEEVMTRNEIMLLETRDTITVPAAFMLRVLASINSIRSGRRAASAARGTEREAENQASDTE